MKFLVLMCISVALASTGNYARYNIEQASTYFEEFITTHNKKYEGGERSKRLEIFTRNLKEINRLNQLTGSAVYGITIFSDLTTEEFINNYTGLKNVMGWMETNNLCNNGTHNGTNAPESFDWRQKNVVSRVKDQQKCGSCWAFGATGNLESQYAIKYGEFLEVSEQQLVDCDDRSAGCLGTEEAANPFMYWVDNTGAMLENDYPYVGEDGECVFDASKVKVKVNGCTLYHPKNEELLKQILYEVGPLTIAVSADGFHFYHGGILPLCPDLGLNHVVLLVGYGSENGVPFWLIKNSWASSWGEEGYVKVKRGVNACGLMDSGMVSAVLG